MNRYLLTAWARRGVLVLFCLVAIIYGIRQASQTYKVWFPDHFHQKKPVQVVRVIPDAAKTIGEQFLWQYYADQKEETERKGSLIEWMTPNLQSKWEQNTALQRSKFDFKRVLLWSEKWLAVDKQAAIEYLVIQEDGRRLHFRLSVVRSGETWLVDQLPSLLPPPKQNTDLFQPTTSISEQEHGQVEQAVDGFFSSWLLGRMDANTRAIHRKLYPLLKTVGGNYHLLSVVPLQEKPLVVDAMIMLKQEKNEWMPLQYRLELSKDKDQYVVKKIIGD
ncbi:Conjugative transposon protein TcpC [Seinonella peptonophila]|uniref:Conjugative transposon protein TcpC n=1 Tax=Seinonella peptonophila TaxID=112248 RepID=A0A1M4ZZB1_9BACL|nr:conjugal transfer protein [Seinonella peptonophila]SHF23380.1 Conjugative transposon protein TcpC [Seinonella peptonophila]